uniref:Uncharacterized protein n=1 Tax=Arundo donax TaxID=35708 RepID=A0A0A9FLU3_ARUDO
MALDRAHYAARF